MGYRTIEINKPTELHIRKGQLEITQEEGSALVALEDLAGLVLAGPDIRVSSLALSALAEWEVAVVICGAKQMPTAHLIPDTANARQALLARRQVYMPDELRDALWQRLIVRKIENQARTLAILGKEKVAEVAAFAPLVEPGDPLNAEGSAAQLYFPALHEGLNRRTDDPFNSVLNYGYAIIRAALAKSICATGFIACFGIHHANQYNNFNLADDLIEPFRPMVDVMAPSVVQPSLHLSKEQRHRLVGVLHHECLLEGTKTTVLKAVERVVDSFRRAVESGDAGELATPVVLEPVFRAEVEE